MLAGALAQWLEAGGFAQVLTGGLGDYSATRPTTYAVSVESGADATWLGDGGNPWYEARVQVRAQASNSIAAEEALWATMPRIRDARGATLSWDNPLGGVQQYEVSTVRAVTRPTWFPSPGEGEVATSNYRLRVRRL